MTGETAVSAEHGGYHPFLVDEFLRSVLDGRPPMIDARRSAAWTAPGIAAHASAPAGGVATPVPDYLAG